MLYKFRTLIYNVRKNSKGKAVLLQAFQEVKVPRFHDNSTGWW